MCYLPQQEKKPCSVMRAINLTITNNQKKNKKAFLQFFYAPKEFLENILKKYYQTHTSNKVIIHAQIYGSSKSGFDP